MQPPPHMPPIAHPGGPLPGREEAMSVAPKHAVTGAPMREPFPAGTEVALFALGCFWGAEKALWRLSGVVSTMVGYAGGVTPNPTYKEVRSGRTGHAEAVRVVYDPKVVSYDELLKAFWESHDPTQGMRQGPDVGTQYRSIIFALTPTQRQQAEASREAFQRALSAAGLGAITTDIVDARPFYYAEDYHQQYRNPSAIGVRRAS